MQPRIIVTASLSLLWLSCVPSREPAATPPRRTPTAEERVAPAAPVDRARVAENREVFDALLDNLLPGMGAADVLEREKPQQEFEQICFQAGAPGAEAARMALCEAMLARLGPQTAQPARVWLLRQLARLAGEESVSGLTSLLTDDDPYIRELARQALQNNPSPSATLVLGLALNGAGDPAWRVALINALAARRDPIATTRLAQLALDPEPTVARAAIAALAQLADNEAVQALRKVRRENEVLREPAAAALLRCAERLTEAGARTEAIAIYEELWSSTEELPTRTAALRGLAVIEQADLLPRLSPIIRGQDTPELQAVAARLAGDLPGEQATRELVLALEPATPAFRALLLDVLAERGDPAAKPAVINALRDDDIDVRVAALRALESLGDTQDIVRLASVAAGSDGTVRETARRTLARLRGFSVDPAILLEIDRQSEPDIRAELIRSLASRNFRLAAPTLLNTAADSSPVLRIASFEALSRLAGQTHLPELLKRLLNETDDEVRTAAEDAVTTICLRDKDRERRCAAVLAALDTAAGGPRASLIRVLGRLQGTAALAAVRAALHHEDDRVVDVAVRALANWGDATAAADLAQVAEQTGNEAHHVLALRGLVRLAALYPTPAERSASLAQALALARRDEERKLILGSLGAVRHVDALALTKSHLTDPTLRDEAAVATAQIACNLGGEQPDLARATLDELAAGAFGEAAQKHVRAALELLDRYQGYIGTWSVAGPYLEKGRSFDAIFDRPFAPETPEDEAVEWRQLDPASPDNPWVFNLKRVANCGNCCVYVIATIFSPTGQPARLEIGSDDAVKAWFNGELVHSRLAQRGLTCGEDRVDIRLNEGKNTLLLKIVQAGGDFAFCCGVRGPDGQPIAGLKFAGR